MKKKYQVFISSTYEDLKNERAAIIEALLETGFIPIGMEQFPASPLDQSTYIKKTFENIDYYILVLAGRYGSIEPKSGKSYTELEYDYAKNQKIPILVFLQNEPLKLPAEKYESSDIGKEKLNKFRNKVINGGTLFHKYINASDLKAEVIKALSQAVEDCPRIGWIRADTIEESNQFKIHKTNLGKIEDISKEALILLEEAVNDPTGELKVYSDKDNVSIVINNKVLNPNIFGFSSWNKALQELKEKKMLEEIPSGLVDKLYELTSRAYKLLEATKSK